MSEGEVGNKKKKTLKLKLYSICSVNAITGPCLHESLFS